MPSKKPGPPKRKWGVKRFPEREIQRELSDQFWELVRANDENGFWLWVIQQSELDDDQAQLKKWAQSAWRDARAVIEAARRQRR